MKIETRTFINDATGERITRQVEVYDSACLDSPDHSQGHATPCEGDVFPRQSLSGSGMTFERCEKHYGEYVDLQQARLDAIRKRYPESAPADFDPGYAGESWDEDY